MIQSELGGLYTTSHRSPASYSRLRGALQSRFQLLRRGAEDTRPPVPGRSRGVYTHGGTCLPIAAITVTGKRPPLWDIIICPLAAAEK